MKKYILVAVVDGKNVSFDKKFKSRDDAIDYMFKYYTDHFMYNIQVEEEFAKGDDQHNVEYVCNNYNRFRIARV